MCVSVCVFAHVSYCALVHICRFAYAFVHAVRNFYVFVLPQLRHESLCVWVCVGVCESERKRKRERERDREKQGVDGSWWVSTPAAATSTLGQLMFSELTGISPTTPTPNPPPLSVPFSLSLDRLPL